MEGFAKPYQGTVRIIYINVLKSLELEWAVPGTYTMISKSFLPQLLLLLLLIIYLFMKLLYYTQALHTTIHTISIKLVFYTIFVLNLGH